MITLVPIPSLHSMQQDDVKDLKSPTLGHPPCFARHAHPQSPLPSVSVLPPNFLFALHHASSSSPIFVPSLGHRLHSFPHDRSCLSVLSSLCSFRLQNDGPFALSSSSNATNVPPTHCGNPAPSSADVGMLQSFAFVSPSCHLKSIFISLAIVTEDSTHAVTHPLTYPRPLDSVVRDIPSLHRLIAGTLSKTPLFSTLDFLFPPRNATLAAHSPRDAARPRKERDMGSFLKVSTARLSGMAEA
ncbi:hypothetical protein ONZ45_g2743 [Pleurotus djamor]|nr:hypothetical protein ONZ45_g2743 [Pleurotus djamor]